MALENLHLMFLYVAFCITPGRRQLRCNFFLGIKCFLWIFKVSPRAIVQVRIYLWQLNYSTQCIYVSSDLEMLFSCLNSIEWETNREKNNRTSKKVEFQNTPTDRHGPMVAQRCLGAKTSSPRKFALVSCFELPKRTQNELRFGLILFEMTSYQLILRLRLKYIGALMCFFLSHSFVALAMSFGSLSCWNTHPRPIFNALAGFNALALTVHGPIHRPFDAVQLSCPLSRKTPPKHNVSTSMFDGGDGVLGFLAAFHHLQTRRVELMPKSWILVSSDHNTFTQFSSESLANFRWACTCAFLSRGTMRALQDFSPSRRSVLPIVFLVTMVPAALRSLTRSSRVVLGWFLTVLMIIETPRDEILHGAPDRGRLTVILCFFHLRIIAPTVVTFSPSCLAMVL